MASEQRRVAQCWYSVGTLSFLLELAESTIRRRIQAGDFGPETGEPITDYVLDLDGDLRVSTRGYFWYVSRHPYRYDAEIKARNAGELRRKLALVQQRGEASDE
jgi:hypothetical protein